MDVQPRFNERFILSLASCHACLVVDDELNVLPISTHCRAIKPVAAPEGAEHDADQADFAAAGGGGGRGWAASAGSSRDSRELRELKTSLRDTQPIGAIISKVATVDQAKAVLSFVEAASEKSLRTTVALTAGRGRGKSAALGLALASAIAYGYANIFVTSPSPENLRTLFQFVLKGFDALDYKEHTDFTVVESANPDLRKTVVRINVFHQHRQTIQYIEPSDYQLLSQAELLVIDEAAAIPMPQVRQLLGPYLVFLASTVNGYEGTGRALSLKLIQQLRSGKQTAAGAAGGGTSLAVDGSAIAAAEGGVAASGDAALMGRSLREVTLEEPIRYARGDPIESWLHEVLCLDATSHTPAISGCPHPSECTLYWVDRDALFSYHSASESFLQRMIALFVASHYKNTPNDLQLMSDAPAHQLFVLLGPVDVNATRLPDVVAVVQVALEGRISRESVNRSMARGEAPSGDLIPWTLSQQFQESDFAQLSGARVVRVAVHPEMQHMGYGSRAIDQLVHYYQGDLTDAAAARKASSKKGGGRDGGSDDGGAAGTGLLSEQLAPRVELPPLLLSLAQRSPERLHWLGASFGLTQPLFRFWHRLQFLPVYVRQTVNDITGEHTAITLRPLADPDNALPAASRVTWASEYAADFRARLTALLGMSMRAMGVDLALSLLDPELQVTGAAAEVAPSSEQLDYLLGPYDLRRLQSYANNLVDHHLVMDLVPMLARLRFTRKLTTPLSHVQAAILLGLGLQHKSLDDLAAELGLPASQLLALFNKAVRRIVGTLRKVVEDSEAKTLPHTAADAAAASSAMRPLKGGGLDAELDAGAAASLHHLQQEQAKKQAEWLDTDGELAQYAIQGTDADWEAALSGGSTPKHVALKRAAGASGDKAAGGKKRRDGSGDGGGKKRKKP